MRYRFVFRVFGTTPRDMSYRARTEGYATRIVEIHSRDEEGNELVDSVKALEYGRKLAKQRGWELLVVEQVKGK